MHGGVCCYCRRSLTDRQGHATTFTWDHLQPRSRGGRRVVPCCWTCNQLKGDLSPKMWRLFTDTYPRWWKQFRTASEVRRAAVHALRNREDTT